METTIDGMTNSNSQFLIEKGMDMQPELDGLRAKLASLEQLQQSAADPPKKRECLVSMDGQPDEGKTGGYPASNTEATPATVPPASDTAPPASNAEEQKCENADQKVEGDAGKRDGSRAEAQKEEEDAEQDEEDKKAQDKPPEYAHDPKLAAMITAMFAAAKSGSVPVLTKLMEKSGGRTDWRQDYNMRTLLHVAAMADKIQACAWLEAKGAYIDASDKDGKKPYELAGPKVKQVYQKYGSFIAKEED